MNLTLSKVLYKNNYKKIVWKIIRSILIIGISFVILMPIIGRFSNALMSRADIYDRTVIWIPRQFSLNNLSLAFRYMQYPLAAFNSTVLSGMVAIFQLISCSLVGYGFARFNFKGKNFFFALVIFSLIIPPQMIHLPMYLNFRYFDFYGLLREPINLLRSYWPFVVTSLTGTGLRNGFFIYIMRQFFKGMSDTLEEAAYVDGAGILKTFVKIMLPSAIPALVVVFLFSVVWQWNDSYLSHLLMQGEIILPEMLRQLPQNVLGRDFAQVPEESSLLNNAGALLFMLPPILLYSFLQKFFVESIEKTGLGDF